MSSGSFFRHLLLKAKYLLMPANTSYPIRPAVVVCFRVRDRVLFYYNCIAIECPSPQVQNHMYNKPRPSKTRHLRLDQFNLMLRRFFSLRFFWTFSLCLVWPNQSYGLSPKIPFLSFCALTPSETRVRNTNDESRSVSAMAIGWFRSFLRHAFVGRRENILLRPRRSRLRGP